MMGATIVMGAIAACAAIVPGCAPAHLPACDASFGGIDHGRVIVTIDHDADVPCDLDGTQRLDLVWNADNVGPDWGSDATVAAATTEALDAGCTLNWYNDGGYRLVGSECNY